MNKQRKSYYQKKNENKRVNSNKTTKFNNLF